MTDILTPPDTTGADDATGTDWLDRLYDEANTDTHSHRPCIPTVFSGHRLPPPGQVVDLDKSAPADDAGEDLADDVDTDDADADAADADSRASSTTFDDRDPVPDDRYDDRTSPDRRSAGRSGPTSPTTPTRSAASSGWSTTRRPPEPDGASACWATSTGCCTSAPPRPATPSPRCSSAPRSSPPPSRSWTAAPATGTCRWPGSAASRWPPPPSRSACSPPPSFSDLEGRASDDRHHLPRRRRCRRSPGQPVRAHPRHAGRVRRRPRLDVRPVSREGQAQDQARQAAPDRRVSPSSRARCT